MSSPGGISPAIVSPAVLGAREVPVSPEVQAVLDLMPNPVSASDRARIVAIVDPAVTSGVWAKIDFFFVHAMADPDNALTSWVGTKTATNVNASTHTPLQGYLFNGTTQYLDSGVVLTTDMTNYSLNDGHTECYCYDNSSASTAFLFGVESTISTRTFLFQFDTLLQGKVHTNGKVDYTAIGTFQDNERYGIGRDDSANQEIFRDGVEVETDSDASNSLPSVSIYIGARNKNDVVSSPINAEISYFLLGGGFNLTDLDTMLDTVETEFSL